MNNKALETVLEFNQLCQNDGVIVGVSGGADSMALICFLLEIKDRFSLDIHVCHINHGLRGEDAERDQSFVCDFCQRHSLPFHLYKCDVMALSRELNMGFEECGREVRYKFFSEIADTLSGNVKIATAHTLSDNIETVLLNLSRGSAYSGLAGIAPKRDNIIRPLIRCTRAEIEDYLSRLGQPYMTDDTNFDTDYTRNYIRHKIVPNMYKLNPSLDSSIMNLTDIMRVQSDFMLSCTQSAMQDCLKDGKLLKDSFLSLHTALRREVIAAFLRQNEVEVLSERIFKIDTLIKKGDFKLSLKKDLFLVCRNNEIYFEKAVKLKRSNTEIKPILDEIIFLDDFKLKLSLIERAEFENFKKNDKQKLKNCLDYDIINDSVVFRTRREGDYLTLFPRNVTKTLKKILNESNIELQKRYIMPLLANNSHILWAYEIGVDKDAAVSPKTSRILYIEALCLESKDGE